MTRDQQDRPRSIPSSDRIARGPVTPDRPSPMVPGDPAPSGTPDAGRTIRKTCRGKGQSHGRTVPKCQGSGTVIEGTGDA